MAEIDMIPQSYRDGVRVQTTVKRFATFLLLLIMLGLLAFAGLRWRITVETPRLAQLRAATDAVENARKGRDALRLRKAALDQRMTVLSALRGAGDVARVTTAIDQALGQGVWFRELRFSREEKALPAGGTPGAAAAGAAVAGGLTVVVPADVGGKPSPSETQTWRLSKTIAIGGNAVDHAALTTFLQRLAAQPAMTDVRFLNSTMRVSDGARVVDFNLTASTRVAAAAP